MRHLKILSVFGTRPEAIKMAPVIQALNKVAGIDSRVCTTGQHQQMLKPVLDLFGIAPHYNLNVMQKNQNLSSLSAKILEGLSIVFQQYVPDLVLVHGDTTTTFVASLAAFYHKIPVAHIEAGLRTGNLLSPWPEEANRKLAATLATLHFAPTESARQNLLKEGVDSEAIFVTGNTVVDALEEAIQYIKKEPAIAQNFMERFSFIQPNRKFILVTGHRRENFGQGFEQICAALLNIARMYSDIDIVYPVHLNPNVQEPVNTYLANQPNIHLIEPVDYLPFVFLMQKSYLILTDSGGIQEEAPSLGKPVLVMRNHTERMEALKAGTVKLVGTNTQSIMNEVTKIIQNPQYYSEMSNADNPYGDGRAAQRIVDSLISSFNLSPMDTSKPVQSKEEISAL